MVPVRMIHGFFFNNVAYHASLSSYQWLLYLLLELYSYLLLASRTKCWVLTSRINVGC
jgi:hypothetical protein